MIAHSWRLHSMTRNGAGITESERVSRTNKRAPGHRLRTPPEVRLMHPSRVTRHLVSGAAFTPSAILHWTRERERDDRKTARAFMVNKRQIHIHIYSLFIYTYVLFICMVNASNIYTYMMAFSTFIFSLSFLLFTHSCVTLFHNI